MKVRPSRKHPMRLACLLSLTLASLVACDDGYSTDIDASLRFADRSDGEISRLAGAATGNEGFSAQANVMRFDDNSSEPDPCPAIAVDAGARTVTITGGCTTVDGVEIQGSALVKNPLSWGDTLEGDFTEATRFEMTGFALVQQSYVQSFDGHVEIGSLYDYVDMDITTKLLDIEVRTDLRMDCNGGTSCDFGGGVELIGAGGAHVSGEISVSGQSATTHVTLDGKDTLDFDIENNCVTWRISGTERMYTSCPQ